jgi:hypothetical protein
MKIGIIFTAYNCDGYIERVLSPWVELRDELNLVLTANSGMFSDYVKLGFKEKNDFTLKQLVKSKLDFLVTTSGKHLLDEDSSRSLCLDYLKKQKCDLVWAVDGDEIYTKEDIRNVIDYIKANSEYDVYGIQFKNYTLKYPLYTKGFYRQTIYWSDRQEGLSHFHFDVFMTFNNGKRLEDLDNVTIIPKEVAYIDHYSWLSNDSRSAEKVLYQNQRYTWTGPEGKRCSFSVEDDELVFNKLFWEYRNVEIPILHEKNNPFSYNFDLTFSRRDNCFYISEIKKEQTLKFLIFDLSNNTLYYETTLSILPDVSYYMCPDATLHFDSLENFKGFNIQVWENDELIHNENFYLNL